MIRKISFKNFKCFHEGEIVISPLTIFLGANSVGKSAVIGLLLMLQETAKNKEYTSALKLYGSKFSLGEPENIFTNRNPKKDLQITVEFKDRNLYEDLKSKNYDSLVKYSYTIFLNSINNENSKNVKYNFSNLSALREKVKDTLIYPGEMTEKKFSKITSLTESIYETDREFKKNYYNTRVENVENDVDKFYSNFYHFIDKAATVKESIFSIVYNIGLVDNGKVKKLELKKVALLNRSVTILEITPHKNSSQTKNDIIVKSSYLFNQRLLSDSAQIQLNSIVTKYDNIFYIFHDSAQSLPSKHDFLFPPVKIISDIFKHVSDTLVSHLSEEMLHYVGPLRAHPKRYYFLDSNDPDNSIVGLSGVKLTEILNSSQDLRSKVNKWLKRLDIHVNIETLQDIIHKLKVSQGDLTVDITDVGFGISQALPVIVQGFVSKPGSLTIIEQPEIHLHPAIQADLADLFIEIINSSHSDGSSKYLIIETHSEYFLKRLRRRISEKQIDDKNVSIYFFEQNFCSEGLSCSDKSNCNNDSISCFPVTQIERKNVSNTGYFEWPKSFYSGELLKDSIEFIKNQG